MLRHLLEAAGDHRVGMITLYGCPVGNQGLATPWEWTVIGIAPQ